MKIVAKKGFEMDVIVKGFRNEPKTATIKVSFVAGGKSVKDEFAEIVRNGKIAEGLYFQFLNGYVECSVSEIEKAISELPIFVAPEKPKVEPVIVPEGYEIVSIDGVEGFYKIPQFKAKEETPKAKSENKPKANLENIMFDNESEDVDRFNGFEVDKFALVGIDEAEKTESLEICKKESQIENLISEIADLVHRIENYDEDDPIRLDVLGDFKEGKLGNSIVELLEQLQPYEKIVETDYGYSAGSFVVDHEGINDIETGETIKRGW
jgi:hypothetical protein